MILLRKLKKYYDGKSMKTLSPGQVDAIDEIVKSVSVLDEAYVDFHVRFAKSPEIKKCLLEHISSDLAAGVDSKEVLRRHVYH